MTSGNSWASWKPNPKAQPSWYVPYQVERCTDTRMPMRAEKKATTPDFAGYQQLSAITWSIPPGIDTFQTTSTDEQVSRAYHIPSRRIATVAWMKCFCISILWR